MVSASNIPAVAAALAASANRFGVSAASLAEPLPHSAVVAPAAAPAHLAAPPKSLAGISAASAPTGGAPLEPSVDPRAKDLIDLAIKTLKRALDNFIPVKNKINKRIKHGQWLNRGSATLTVILSSGVWGNLQFGGKETWTTALGLMTLFAALLTLVASWAGDAKFVDEFGEISSKAEKASALLDRLDVYSKNPERFPDWSDRIKEASELADFISDKIGRWNVGVT